MEIIIFLYYIQYNWYRYCDDATTCYLYLGNIKINAHKCVLYLYAFTYHNNILFNIKV